MKKNVLFFLLMVVSISVSATEVRLTNGVSFDMPEGYEYFKHKSYPYSAKRGNDVLYLSAMYGDTFDKKVFYTSADTMFYNLSRANMEREEHSKIWQLAKKNVKRYYKLSKDTYAVTYSCHTESEAGFVMIATYSTVNQLEELEKMFKSIKIAHKGWWKEFSYTFCNGGWLLILVIFVMFGIKTVVPLKMLTTVEVIMFVVCLGLVIIIWWGATFDILLNYFVSGIPIYLFWLFVEEHIPYRKHRIVTHNNAGEDGDGGGDDGGDDSSGNEHIYVTSDDGTYYNPIDF
ncbi:MAG: hypothetical protein IKY87_05030 [Paludibacteraceae bacterium]|nr:hypothetical protein [Paludibacteraceae bacterium]